MLQSESEVYEEKIYAKREENRWTTGKQMSLLRLDQVAGEPWL